MASIAVQQNPQSWNDIVVYFLSQIATSSTGVGPNVNIASVGGVATTLGQKTMAASFPVVLASDQSSIAVTPSLPTGASTSALQTIANAFLSTIDGHLNVNLSTLLADATFTARINTLGQKTMANSTPVVLSSDQSSIPVTAPTITKGTQGANGFTVQDLKDAGRNQTNFFTALPVISTATDTLISLTGYKSGAAVVATTTPAVVTAGKTYRITSITYTVIGIATIGSIQFNLRANTGGTVVIGSPLVFSKVVGVTSATAGNAQSVTFSFPDGIEFAAGTGIGISILGLSATQVAAARGYADIVIAGYEY